MARHDVDRLGEIHAAAVRFVQRGLKQDDARLRTYDGLPPLFLCDEHAALIAGRGSISRVELESMAAEDLTSREFMWTQPEYTTVALYDDEGRQIGGRMGRWALGVAGPESRAATGVVRVRARNTLASGLT